MKFCIFFRISIRVKSAMQKADFFVRMIKTQSYKIFIYDDFDSFPMLKFLGICRRI
jgi:hypothetical protein